jgi:hypothetical protein
VATDLIQALIDAAAADGTLAAAGLGTWHFGVDPESGYPYLVISDLGGRKPMRTFGKGQIHENHYRINIYDDDKANAATLGIAVRTFLESLKATPPTFDDGRLMDSHQNGDVLALPKPRRPGTEGQPFIWINSFVWTFKTSRDRAS